MLDSLLYGGAYSLVGIALLALGYLAFDLLTPGHLGRHIYEHRSANAAAVVSSAFLGLGAVTFTAIWTNADSGFGQALLWTVGFGLLGIVLQLVSFVILDLLTPGSLRALVVEPGLHPGALVAAASMLAVSAVVCASIA